MNAFCLAVPTGFTTRNKFRRQLIEITNRAALNCINQRVASVRPLVLTVVDTNKRAENSTSGNGQSGCSLKLEKTLFPRTTSLGRLKMWNGFRLWSQKEAFSAMEWSLVTKAGYAMSSATMGAAGTSGYSDWPKKGHRLLDYGEGSMTRALTLAKFFNRNLFSTLFLF